MTKQLKIILIGVWVVVGLTVGGVVAGVLIYRTIQSNHAATAASTPDIKTADQQIDPHHLEPLFNAPSFSLIDQTGKKFDSSQLHGKVWVADFVFTTCTGLCPLMTRQMAEFQNQTAGLPIQMVSFSVDPQRDTPAALTAYARDAKADLTRWHFLTGEDKGEDKETLWNISKAMKLAVDDGDGSDHQVMHSSHFLLVDKDGRVRGVYDYKNAGFMAELVSDATKLCK
jgi:protein SCO1/2